MDPLRKFIARKADLTCGPFSKAGFLEKFAFRYILCFQIVHISIAVTSGGAKRHAEAGLSGAASSLSKAKTKVLRPSPPSSTSSSVSMYDEEVNEGGEGRNTLDLALLKDDAAPLSPASAGLLTPPKICL